MRKTLFAMAVLAVAVQGVVVTVPRGKRECLIEKFEAGEYGKVMYGVLEGGNMHVDFTVEDPDGGHVFHKDDDHEGKVDFRAEKSGAYKFCLDKGAGKKVSIDVSKESRTGFVDTGFAQDTSALTPLEESVFALAQSLEETAKEQDYILMRDIAHKNETDRIQKYVWYWFVFEILLILALAAFQIFYITRFFEARRAV